MMVGKCDGLILSRLWTNVREISGYCRRPYVVSKDVRRLYIACLTL